MATSVPKVHIVCRTLADTERILSRMANLLSSATGWSVGARPDPNAVVNYWFPYLEMRKQPIEDGQFTAAYFTHREDILPAKVQIWRNQAAKVSLRLTSAAQYATDLSQHGLTRLVTPPLDRRAFSPGRPRSPGAPFVAGVSGYRYSGGRKGEALLAQVLMSTQAEAFEWRAIGRGWPVKTRLLPQRDVPDWYRSLDLFVCTSLIEGIPYPVLEALACGVPVVIPCGVGLLDELPEVPGIVRYDRGDAPALAHALRKAGELIASGECERETLRATTERFTVEAWVSGHIDAFAALGAPEKATAEQAARAERARGAGRGIFAVAYGEPARNCAERLIASVRRHMPGVPVAVASERPLPSADISVAHPDADLGGRTAKTKMWELAPAQWREVLYLDADTELTADISFLFDALADGWDLVATKDQDGYDLIFSLWRRDAAEMRLGRQAIGSDRALQLAGGVVGFRRSEAVARFLERWYAEWKVLARRDQGALLRALYAEPVRLLVLGCEWNSFVGVFKGETAGIIHHRGGPARRLHKWSAGRLDDTAAWQKALAGAGRRRPLRRIREERKPRLRGKGSWFVHRTGARQFAAPGTKAYERLAGSAAWQQAPEPELTEVTA